MARVVGGFVPPIAAVSVALLGVWGCKRGFEPGVVTAAEDRAGCAGLVSGLDPEEPRVDRLGTCRDDLAACQRECEEGLLMSCATVARRRADGDGLPRDARQAQALALRNCEAGFAPSCRDAAELSVELATYAGEPGRLGEPPSTEVEAAAHCSAFVAYEAGCALGDHESCERMRSVHPDLLSLDEQLAVSEAGRTVERACVGGDMRGCLLCVHRHLSVDPARTAGPLTARDGACHEAACKGGYALGCVGRAYAAGHDLPQERRHEAVIAALTEQCDAGSAGLACDHLSYVRSLQAGASAARAAWDAREEAREAVWSRVVEANRALSEADRARHQYVAPGGSVGAPAPFDWSTLAPRPATSSGITTCAGGYYGAVSTGAQGYICP